MIAKTIKFSMVFRFNCDVVIVYLYIWSSSIHRWKPSKTKWSVWDVCYSDIKRNTRRCWKGEPYTQINKVYIIIYNNIYDCNIKSFYYKYCIYSLIMLRVQLCIGPPFSPSIHSTFMPSIDGLIWIDRVDTSGSNSVKTALNGPSI